MRFPKANERLICKQIAPVSALC